MFTFEAIACQRGGIGDSAKAHCGAGQQLQTVLFAQGTTYTGPWPHQAHHLMPTLQQRANGGLPDGAGGAEHEDASGWGGRGAAGLNGLGGELHGAARYR